MKKLLFIAVAMCIAACTSTSEPKSDAKENDTTNVVKQDSLIEKQDTTPTAAKEVAPSPEGDPTLYTLVLEMKNGTKKEEKFHAKDDSEAIAHMAQIGIKDQGKTLVRGTLLNYKGEKVNTKENASKAMKKAVGVSPEEIDKELEDMNKKLKELEEMDF